MKKTISIILLAVSLIACQTNKSKNDQEAKTLQLEEKISQPSTEKVIEQQKKTNLQEEENEVRISQIEKLKTTYTYIRAKFIVQTKEIYFTTTLKTKKVKTIAFHT
tara:strand:- start:982 stop:1299 length:318 start_codon:yes stop_codon:yes gene_type:complete